jgi:hypothetical protein
MGFGGVLNGIKAFPRKFANDSQHFLGIQFIVRMFRKHRIEFLRLLRGTVELEAVKNCEKLQKK